MPGLDTGLTVLAVAGALVGVAQGDSGIATPIPDACKANVAVESAQADRRPKLLMIHGGGFVLSDDAEIGRACSLATEAGFDVSYVDYPLGNLPAAVAATEQAARREARSGLPVYAYGESAGGTLAALLARKRLVDAAATYSQLTDLVAYYSRTPNPALFKRVISASRDDLKAASPGFREHGGPVLALLPSADDPNLNEDTLEWQRRATNVESTIVDGEHIGGGDVETYEENVSRALVWLGAAG